MTALDPWQEKPVALGYDAWEYYLCHDFGSSAPSVTYVVAKSPGIEGPDKRYYPKGSLVLIDELATNEPGSLAKGMGYTVPMLSEEIKDMCKEWKIKPQGVGDDACFIHSVIVMYHRQSRWLERSEPLKAVENLEPPEGGY